MTRHFTLAAALLAASTAMASAAELKLGYALSEDSHYGAGAKAFADTLQAELGDAFMVQQFPNSGLGGEREVIVGASSRDLRLSTTVSVDGEEADFPYSVDDLPRSPGGRTTRRTRSGAWPISGSRSPMRWHGSTSRGVCRGSACC